MRPWFIVCCLYYLNSLEYHSFFFKFYFIFKLYNIVLVLPNIRISLLNRFLKVYKELAIYGNFNLKNLIQRVYLNEV